MNGVDEKKYDDIINTKWPPAAGFKTPMDLENRAKIFLPFAALKGFEDEVEGRLHDEIEKMNDRTGRIQFSECMQPENM